MVRSDVVVAAGDLASIGVEDDTVFAKDAVGDSGTRAGRALQGGAVRGKERVEYRYDRS